MSPLDIHLQEAAQTVHEVNQQTPAQDGERKKLQVLMITPVYPPFVSVGGGVAITVSCFIFVMTSMFMLMPLTFI